MPDTLTVPEKISSTEELDELLATLGKLQLQHEALTQKLNQRIAKANESYAGQLAEIDSEIARGIEAVRQFVRRKRQAIFGDESSVQLPGGTLQIRQNPERCVIEDEEAAIHALIRAGLGHLIVERTSIDRNGIKRPDIREQLAGIEGISFARDERLTITPAGLKKGLSNVL